jgi:hypothetical protein
VWTCSKLNRKVSIKDNAIPNTYYGFICDCGQWVLNGDVEHKIVNIKTFDCSGFPYDIIVKPTITNDE